MIDKICESRELREKLTYNEYRAYENMKIDYILSKRWRQYDFPALAATSNAVRDFILQLDPDDCQQRGLLVDDIDVKDFNYETTTIVNHNYIKSE